MVIMAWQLSMQLVVSAFWCCWLSSCVLIAKENDRLLAWPADPGQAVLVAGGSYMDSAKEIVVYLEAVARLLVERGVRTQIHLLIAGGAYMLLQQQRRSTHDIDFAQIIPPQRVRPNE